jgi:hypothetical protein
VLLQRRLHFGLRPPWWGPTPTRLWIPRPLHRGGNDVFATAPRRTTTVWGRASCRAGKSCCRGCYRLPVRALTLCVDSCPLCTPVASRPARCAVVPFPARVAEVHTRARWKGVAFKALCAPLAADATAHARASSPRRAYPFSPPQTLTRAPPWPILPCESGQGG